MQPIRGRRGSHDPRRPIQDLLIQSDERLIECFGKRDINRFSTTKAQRAWQGSRGKLQADTAGNPQGDRWLTGTGQYHVIEGLDTLETVLDLREPVRPSRVRNDDRVAARDTAFILEIGELARIT